MADKIFYVLDLGCCAPSDFIQDAAPYTAISAIAAAEDWASTWDECHDGMTGECLVADNPSGDGARPYRVRCRIITEFIAESHG